MVRIEVICKQSCFLIFQSYPILSGSFLRREFIEGAEKNICSQTNLYFKQSRKFQGIPYPRTVEKLSYYKSFPQNWFEDLTFGPSPLRKSRNPPPTPPPLPACLHRKPKQRGAIRVCMEYMVGKEKDPNIDLMQIWWLLISIN